MFSPADVDLSFLILAFSSSSCPFFSSSLLSLLVLPSAPPQEPSASDVHSGASSVILRLQCPTPGTQQTPDSLLALPHLLI